MAERSRRGPRPSVPDAASGVWSVSDDRSDRPAVPNREMRPPEVCPAHTYEVMATVQRRHWWHLAKRRLVQQALDDLSSRCGRSLDVGCGAGGLVTELADRFSVAIGTDVEPLALRLAGVDYVPPGVVLLAAAAERLPFASGSFDAVTSCDVIEHLDDDVGALREFHRVLRPGGVLAVAVPAYQWAWSDHDVSLGHRRRYTVRSLTASAESAGFHVEQATYFHSWLVPRRGCTPEDALAPRCPTARIPKPATCDPPLNRVLTRVGDVERTAIHRLGRLPFGLSAFLAGRKT